MRHPTLQICSVSSRRRVCRVEGYWRDTATTDRPTRRWSRFPKQASIPTSYDEASTEERVSARADDKQGHLGNRNPSPASTLTPATEVQEARTLSTGTIMGLRLSATRQLDYRETGNMTGGGVPLFGDPSAASPDPNPSSVRSCEGLLLSEENKFIRQESSNALPKIL
jgi:hypothetical protein